MCGITGWVSFQRDLSAEHGTLTTMTRTQARRGPDASGIWLGRHAALGHQRLAVIDIDGGVQPMVSDTPDGPVALTYSGEVYNFTELRSELRRRGHRFRTESDTEVVLRGYLEWGTELPERLNGMYAFGIWDGRTGTERLLLVRDRLGVKPLYYQAVEDGVVFGSEPKAILANPLVCRTVDADGLREVLGGALTPGHAFWAGMHEVLPGALVTVDRGGLRKHVYWTLGTEEHDDDLDATIDRVRTLLDDTVRRQLVADVPRCVLLSGGLDSSGLTALAARQARGQNWELGTVSVDFTGQAKNFRPDELRPTPDSPYISQVAEHVGSRHTSVVLDHEALADPEVRRRAVGAWDIPLGLGELANSLYLLFAGVRAHATVALSGESADEVFGGYRWFRDPRALSADTFPWRPLLADGICIDLVDPDLVSMLDIDHYVADRYADALAEVPEPPDPARATESERTMRRICYLNLTRFLRMMLDRKDRMSMAVGLEVRVPFCDHRLVEYLFNTPWSMKTFDGREKSLLRAATRELLPSSVANRVKSQYPTSQDTRYVGALRDQVTDLVAADHPAMRLFDGRQVRRALRRTPEDVRPNERAAFEQILDLAAWWDLRSPTLAIN